MGKKVPLLETTSVVGVPSTSSQNLNAQSVKFTTTLNLTILIYNLFYRDPLWRTIQVWIQTEET